MSEWKRYRRINIAEMRRVEQGESPEWFDAHGISISAPDRALCDIDPAKWHRGFVARNPNDYTDQWYVAVDYANENFEEVSNDN